MRNKQHVYERVMEGRIVAILRKFDTAKAVAIAETLVAAGIPALEVTMDTPSALEAIAAIRRAMHEKAAVGAGTVLDAETARAAILEGAQFIVAPNLNRDVITMSHSYNVPVMPGCMTPSEIQQAYEWGCDIVKVFPAHVVGPAFFRSIKGPLDHVTLMATGGINVDNAQEFREQGADVLGIGGSLVSAELVAEDRFESIRELAQQLVRKAR